MVVMANHHWILDCHDVLNCHRITSHHRHIFNFIWCRDVAACVVLANEISHKNRRRRYLCIFNPFHFKEKFYDWDSLSACYVRTYSPLLEYGGWGIKYGFGGQGLVYNVSGNVGLQLKFKVGEPLLIGTQKGEEIKALLAELGRLTESVK